MGATYIFIDSTGYRLDRSWHLSWKLARRKAQRVADKEKLPIVIFYDESNPNVEWDNHSDDK